jgi:hypothetical protein
MPAPPTPDYYQNLLAQQYNPEFVRQLEAAGETLEQRQARDQRNLQATIAGHPGVWNTTNQGRTDAEQQALMGQHQGWGPDPLQRPPIPLYAPMSETPLKVPPAPQLEQAPVLPPPPPPPEEIAPVGSGYDFSGIPSVEEGFGDPYVTGSTYYKMTGPDGKLTYTNVPQTVASGLGGPVDTVEMATQQGATLKGKGGSAEVMIGGRTLPGPDATRAEVEALPEADQMRWYQRMMGARTARARAIQDKLADYNLQEATLPWDVRMQREAQKQAALYEYVTKMPEFQGLTDKIIDEKIEQLKMAEPERMKDPEKLQQAIAAIRPLAEKEAQARIQERLMMIMMGSSSVAGRYAANPMMAMMMGGGGMGMGMGGP